VRGEILEILDVNPKLRPVQQAIWG